MQIVSIIVINYFCGRYLNDDKAERMTMNAFQMWFWNRVITISAASILDISKYRDTCERSISILDGIAILRYIEYRMIRRYLGDISYDPEYRPIRYLNNRRYGSIARKPRYRNTYTTDSSIFNTSD